MDRRSRLASLAADHPLIAPSMLKCDFADLVGELSRLDAAGADVIHWDVMDGHFVPNLSYGPMLIRSARKRSERFFDAHLMISNPEKCLDEYLQAGCDAITIHIEAVPDPTPVLWRIREAGRVAGLALNPGTPVSAIEPFLPACDLVLVMSVQPGFGGQKFMPEVLPKLQRLKEIVSPKTVLSIDGGIAAPTISAASAAGARLFVAGSSVFDAAEYGPAIADLAILAGA